MADILTLQLMYDLIGARRTKQYFDDSGDGVISDADTSVQMIFDMAEGEMYSRMFRAYSSRDEIITYAENDAAFRGNLTMVAAHLASERRGALTDSEGDGAYKAAYDRAMAYFDNVSRGLQRGTGEAGTLLNPGPGPGANTGGNLQPSPPADTGRQFVFTPNKNSPTGYGGF